MEELKLPKVGKRQRQDTIGSIESSSEPSFNTEDNPIIDKGNIQSYNRNLV